MLSGDMPHTPCSLLLQSQDRSQRGQSAPAHHFSRTLCSCCETCQEVLPETTKKCLVLRQQGCYCRAGRRDIRCNRKGFENSLIVLHRHRKKWKVQSERPKLSIAGWKVTMEQVRNQLSSPPNLEINKDKQIKERTLLTKKQNKQKTAKQMKNPT